MRLLILVNVLDGGDAGATTYRLAADCVTAGHDVWITSPGKFSYDPDDSITALARAVPPGSYKSTAEFVAALKKNPREQWVTVDEWDVLLLRNNPWRQKPWAQDAGIEFGRLAARRGVLVLNDPDGLARAMSKLYLQSFPEQVRPRTLITRNRKKIAAFARDEGTIILKPLRGSGGHGVFILREADIPNLGPIVRSISRDGYVIAQEYLEAAAEGDTRLFLLNGVPLRHEGKYAAVQRVRSGDDIRSNVHAGGRARRVAVDDTMLRVAEAVRPRLVADGMFLVGLDIAGDKLMELNVFSPGGLGDAGGFENVDFIGAVIAALARKVEYMAYYGRNLDNAGMCVL